jgi:hypothetical protein
VSFLIKRLYTQPDVAKITIYHKAHTRTDGSFTHGEHDPESISRMSRYASRMSQTLKDHIYMGPTKLRLHDQTNI